MGCRDRTDSPGMKADCANPVLRVCGDPWRSDAGALRALLAAADQRGMRVGLWVRHPRGDADGQRVPLQIGAHDVEILTSVPGAQLERAHRALATAVPATAPLVVFGSDDEVARAALEWPVARAAWASTAGSTDALLDLVESVQPARTFEVPQLGFAQPDLDAWIALPLETHAHGRWLHPTDGTMAWGSDVLARALSGTDATRRWGKRIEVLWLGDSDPGRHLLEEWDRIGAVWRSMEPSPEALRDAAATAAAWILPWRGLVSAELLVGALASGRAVTVTRDVQTSEVVGPYGVCLPLASRCVDGQWQPEARSLRFQLERLEAGVDAGLTQRARTHVIECLGPGPRPIASVQRAGAGPKPRVVLEAHLFEASSTRELTLETARALQERDQVDVALVPRRGDRGSLEALESRAPDLVPLLTRRPGPCDLWLSSGWPPAVARPADAQTAAVRVDWEYGALPTELVPALHGADRVVVHSQAVARVVGMAGVTADRIDIVPHGVDRAFCAEGPEDSEVLAFKGDTRALLFAGAPIWRKGFDLWIRTLLDLHRRGHPVRGVVKSCGGQSHYAGFELAGLIDRLAEHPQAPPILHLDGELSRPELAAVFRACDLMVHPYRGEGFGMPVLEAMATGLPVVVTSGGATDDFCAGTPGVIQVPAAQVDCDLEGPHEGQPSVLEPDVDALLASCERALDGLADHRAAAISVAAREAPARSWARAAQQIEAMARNAFEARVGRFEPCPPVGSVAPGPLPLPTE